MALLSPSSDPRTDLAEAERQRMRIYAALPSSPLWYYPALGGAMFVLVIGTTIRPAWLSVLTLVSGAALIGAVNSGMVKHVGFVPRIRQMPDPLRRTAIVAIGVWVVVWLGAYLSVWLLTDSLAVAAVVGLSLWVLLVIAGPAYDRHYAAVADQLAADADAAAPDGRANPGAAP